MVAMGATRRLVSAELGSLSAAKDELYSAERVMDGVC
jgi:hypothetical protein